MRSPVALALTFFLALALSPFVSACSGDDDDDGAGAGADAGVDAGSDACGAIEGRCVELSPSDDDQTALQTAPIEARQGDVILLHEGTYAFDNGLSLDVNDVTLRGDGQDKTVLSFAGQTNGAQGLLVNADGFTAEDFTIQDTAGDGIKVEGADRVIFRRVLAQWTTEPSSEHGAYGLYPVQCKNVLIDESTVKGAADAGIYVGQSEKIVVRKSRAESNVAGIEIENSSDADVHDNVATGNAGGILVFNLPGLQVKTGARTRVFNNEIVENNGENFAAPGTTVALVPKGTGMVVLAAHQVEVFDNHFANNQTNNLGIISYFLTLNEFDDPDYDPYPDTLYFHDNTFEGGGDAPSGLLGAVLSMLIMSMEPPLAAVPDIAFDGYLDPDKLGPDGHFMEALNICLQDNGDADFLNLTLNGFDESGLPTFAGPNQDAAPYTCAHDPLPAVVLDGVAL